MIESVYRLLLLDPLFKINYLPRSNPISSVTLRPVQMVFYAN